MYKLVMRFLPTDKRALLELALAMTMSLDSAEKRMSVAMYVKEALADGKITVGEWSKIGSKLGILSGRFKTAK